MFSIINSFVERARKQKPPGNTGGRRDEKQPEWLTSRQASTSWKSN
jgi:hypothetical protein